MKLQQNFQFFVFSPGWWQIFENVESFTREMISNSGIRVCVRRLYDDTWATRDIASRVRQVRREIM